MQKKRTMNPFQFLERVERMEELYPFGLSTAKEDIAREAKTHFDASFKNEGFIDANLQKWPKRVGNRRPKDPVLYETGKLSTSTKVRILAKGVAIINNVKYGGYHNYGNGQKVRKFIGNSIRLNRRIVKIINKRIGDVLYDNI